MTRPLQTPLVTSQAAPAAPATWEAAWEAWRAEHVGQPCPHRDDSLPYGTPCSAQYTWTCACCSQTVQAGGEDMPTYAEMTRGLCQGCAFG